MRQILCTGVAVLGLLAAWPHAEQTPAPQTPASQTPPPQQPSDIGATISGDAGNAPRLAVPPFIALNKDAETVAVARTIADVLWDDLNYEREFTFIPRDVYASVPAATSFADIPFDRWRELNADGVIVGTVEKVSSGFKVEMKMFNVRTHQAVYPRQYNGSNARLFAHTMSDEIHKSQRALNGVAMSKLVFDSDRDNERMTGTVQNRNNKEIYIADYDGENQRRVTVGKTLNISPRWSPNGRSIAYTSYRRGGGQIFISNIFQGTIEEVTKGERIGENWLPAWSPDGTRVAFTSTRDGNPEIYVANRDGSNVRRITNNPAIDITPTWSPSGTQIAFTSDRSGSQQIYVTAADGGGTAQRITTESYCDRATWSPAPYNELAYASRNGPGFDIHILDMATRHMTALTFGEGTNESPAFSPNGRHIAFMSTRSGKSQIFTVSRDGKDVRQITRTGNNEMPDWSKLPETRP
jgi:TolB protein